MENAVVVVDGKCVYFKGYKDLSVINKGDEGNRPMSSTVLKTSHGFGYAGPQALLILRADIDNNKSAVIAVFKKWDYWFNIDREEKSKCEEAPPKIVGYYQTSTARIPITNKVVEKFPDIVKDEKCYIGPQRVKELEEEFQKEKEQLEEELKKKIKKAHNEYIKAREEFANIRENLKIEVAEHIERLRVIKEAKP